MPPIIKVIEGPDTGSYVRLSAGETVVGKGARAALRLSANAVSVEHFVVTQKDESLFIENLSARGTQVNDTRITGKVKIRLRDKIRVADDTVLRIESEGGDSLLTRHRQLVIVLVALLSIIAVIFAFFNPFEKAPPPQDWERAHTALGDYISRQEAAKKYPPRMREYWDSAWRHDAAGDYKASVIAWQQLESMILTAEPPENRAATDKNKQRLNDFLRMARPETALEEDRDGIAGVALSQFIEIRYRRAYQQANQKSNLFE
jgi:pSer/pThr/pTyr-binding forkhead associated (FHA) protein